MDARNMILELHRADSPLIANPDRDGKKRFQCVFCKEDFQKHRLNLLRNHKQCTNKSATAVNLPAYPNILWPNVVKALAWLESCKSSEDVIKVFKDFKPRVQRPRKKPEDIEGIGAPAKKHRCSATYAPETQQRE